MSRDINLIEVSLGLREATLEVEALHGRAVSTDRGAKNADAGSTNRDLLYLADRLQTLSMLVRNEYWVARGQDPLL